MKFGHLFEFHKIPDWYTEYVHYKELKLRITEFKSLKKMNQVKQLKGYYMINKRGQIYSIDFIKDTKPARAPTKKKNRHLSQSHTFNDEETGTLESSSHRRNDLIQDKAAKKQMRLSANFGGPLPNLLASESQSPRISQEDAPHFVKDVTKAEDTDTQIVCENVESNQVPAAEDFASLIVQSKPPTTAGDRGSHRILTDSMRTKQRQRSQLGEMSSNMATIIEENQPDELDEEDLQEKAIVENMLRQNYVRDLDSQSNAGLTHRSNSNHNSRRFSTDQAQMDASAVTQDLTQSLLSGQSTKEPGSFLAVEQPNRRSSDHAGGSDRAAPVRSYERDQDSLLLIGMQRSTSLDEGQNRRSQELLTNQMQIIADLVPELKKKDIINMKPDERDDLVEHSETLSVEWIHAFLDEIYRIDDFFKEKQTELINNFIGLQDKFRIKTEKHETSEKKSRKSKGGAANKNSFTDNTSNGSSKQRMRSSSPGGPMSPEPEGRRSFPNLDQGGMSQARPSFSNLSKTQSTMGNKLLVNDSSRGGSSFAATNSSLEQQSYLTEQQHTLRTETRYRNLQDLQNMQGSDKLNSYIVPEIKEISESIRSKKIHVAKKSMIKDEFEQMVNWKRVFEQIWQQIRWLISFGQINELALRKIMKKFVKNFFLIKDNTITNKLSGIINECSFKMQEGKMTHELQILSDDLLTFYADCFCKGNTRQARTQLDAQYNDMRRKDSNTISFFGGGLLVMGSFFIFLCVCSTAGYAADWNELYAGIDTYYFTSVICFILFSTGFAVQIFRRHNINYTFIFEVDQNYKLIHHQLYRIALIFTFFWFSCLTWQVAMIKLAPEFHDSHIQYFSIILMVGFLALCLMPVHCFYLKGRVQLAKTLWHIIISPFGKVRFRHFFLADVITSMTGPIQHLMIIACYYRNEHFSTGEKVQLANECKTANVVYLVFGFLPYWWRFWQCMNKWHESKQKVHLVNAGKYFSCLVSPFVLLFAVSSAGQGLKYEADSLFWVYFACKFIQTTYCFIWDIYMDWGLFRQNSPDKPNRFLREKINYAPMFYYWAIFSDFILRYVYLLFLFSLGTSDSFFNQIDAMFAISTFAEGFRRAQWALLRVENEQNNNLEAYRTIPIIPPIVNSQEGKGQSVQNN